MSFNYEQSIWGRGTATLKWSDPMNIRLGRCLKSLRKLPEGAKILEIGCGAGAFIRAIKKIRPEWECFGVDLSQEAINTAVGAVDGVRYTAFDGGRFPYEDNNFDAVIFMDVLEHVSEPENFVAEIKRVLKTKGIMYGFVPCEGDKTSLWRWLDKLGWKNNLTNRFAGHVNFFSLAEARKIFINSGFRIKSETYAENILGQILGVAVFKAMGRAANKSGGQINNETFFAQESSAGFSKLKKFVNCLITLESKLLFWLPSPNVHIVAKKL
ncbi:MAG: class I SAM-dependent methyltransferase [Patescibacteria group bacterium]